MAEWLIGVCSTVLTVTMLTVILPEGRLSKFAKPLISLVIIIIVIAPFINSNGYSTEWIKAGETEIKTDDTFLDYITREKIDYYRKNCVKIAEKNGINGSDVLIEYTVAEHSEINILSVSLNLKNAVISSNEEHIVILQRVKREIGEYLSIDLKKVNVYE